MQRFVRYGLPATAMLAMTLLAVSIGHRLGSRAAERRTLEEWDIRKLAEHLNRAGLRVQLQPSRGDGVIERNAYLTTTPKTWDDLNGVGINPGPSRIQEWRGIVYCERVGKVADPLVYLWGDRCLTVGPFVFYGDAELLEHIRAILAPDAPPLAP